MQENRKPHVWARFGRFIRSHKIIFFSFLGLTLIGGSTTLALVFFYQKPVAVAPAKVEEIVVEKPAPIPEPVKYYSPLTGNLIDKETSIKLPVTGLMIENSLNARPQSGLKNSGVIFEAIAEGGITRFLVLYQQEKPQLIGPIRSVRLYDVEWIAAFDASLGHIGGSYKGLLEVRNGDYRDIDQFFNSATYWRATDRYAPHNVYTSFERLDALNAKKGYTVSNFTGFTRVDSKASDTPNATQINITISSAPYNSTYTYDKATNTYLRFQAGAPHLDREDGQITPSVVIAMRVDAATVFEDGYRENITTIGSGPATIFQNGVAIPVTWNKPSKTSQITFTDILGADVPLVRGQTWIAAVKNNGGNVTWQ